MKNIFIHKVAGQKKDAVRVNNEADIPVFLQDSIIVNGDKLTLICVEGVETAPLGVVVGYEKSNCNIIFWKTNRTFNVIICNTNYILHSNIARKNK